MKKLFLVMIGLLLVPNLVSAEVKEIGDYKYTVEDINYKDYICEELEGKEYYIYSYSYANKVVLEDMNSGEAYILDLSKSDNCKPLTQEEKTELEQNDILYNYFWNNDNSITETSTDIYTNAQYILTSDIEINKDKTYFVHDTNKWMIVENPIVDDISNYYELTYIKTANRTEFDLTKQYYKIETFGILSKVSNPTKDEFDNGLYYIITSDIKTQKLFQLENIEFILPKEVSKGENDYKFSREDLIWVYKFGDKYYLEFYAGNVGRSYLYNTDGTIVDFNIEHKYFSYIYGLTKNNLFSIELQINDDVLNMYVMDDKFNIIFEEKTNENYITYLTTIDNVDYFSIESYSSDPDDIRILKITREEIVKEKEKEPVPNTFDGVMGYVILGIISLISLVGAIIITKKVKKVN